MAYHADIVQQPTPPVRSPEWLDQRSLALHRHVVNKLQRQPDAMARVRATLARWRTQVSENTQPYLAEWQAALDAGDEVALALAVEDSERARALRQCSPFCGVLTEAERLAVLRQWRDRPARVAGQPWP